ncbi:hypothetical protein [Streptomyces albus]|uniref:hypothetical protein n=1 Tax=Streptomyces sp. NRRL F-5917 TaxID=1463873 RepID=UPI0004C27A36|nr:hypothetical protein [Streptomyces sp. NRRL F-5917]
MTSTPFPYDERPGTENRQPGDGRPDRDEHPDVEEISAFGEGISPTARAPQIRSHLAECPQCAGVLAWLEEIRETLGTLSGPVRMPEDVADRIDAALAAEAAKAGASPEAASATEPPSTEPSTKTPGTTTPGTAAPGTAAPGTAKGAAPETSPGSDSDASPNAAPEAMPGPPPDASEPHGAVSRETTTEDEPSDRTPAARPGKDSGVSRETSATPSAEAASKHRRPTTDRPPGRAASATGPGTPGPDRKGTSAAGRGSSGPTPQRARRRRRAVFAVVASVAALTVGGVALQALSGSPATEVASDAARPTPEQHVPGASPRGPSTGAPQGDDSGSGDDKQLRKRVQRLLSGQHTPSPSASPRSSAPSRPSEPPSPGTRKSPDTGQNTLRDDALGGGQTVPSCVRDAIGRAEPPLAVDPEATFHHRSGYLVVLPHQGGDTRRADAYLVDPSCISADPPQPGRVLYKGTYARG